MLKFVHSSFHGVGHDFVQQAFRVFGFAPPVPVPEQKDPDPNFSSVRCPNPEEGESVLVTWISVESELLGFAPCLLSSSVFQELSLLLAERENARIVLATDPDADRLAVAERSDGYVTLTAVRPPSCRGSLVGFTQQVIWVCSELQVRVEGVLRKRVGCPVGMVDVLQLEGEPSGPSGHQQHLHVGHHRVVQDPAGLRSNRGLPL